MPMTPARRDAHDEFLTTVGATCAPNELPAMACRMLATLCRAKLRDPPSAHVAGKRCGTNDPTAQRSPMHSDNAWAVKETLCKSRLASPSIEAEAMENGRKLGMFSLRVGLWW